MIYLDNAATTLKKPPEVKKRVMEAFDFCGNAGRGGYKESRMASEIVFKTREEVASLFGAESTEQVVFTQNATHSLNIAIKGIADGGDCAISGYEHNSVVRPLVSVLGETGKIHVAKGKLFDAEDMLKEFRLAIKPGVTFAVCTHMSNVFGYILPIKDIDEICRKKGIPLIIDASQSAGSIPVKLKDFRAVSCICAPGHKGLYGPQGTGMLVCKNGEKMKTLIEGGTGSVSESVEQPGFLPDRFESGTQNLPGIAGLNAGIEFVRNLGESEILRQETELIGFLKKELSKIPSVLCCGSCDASLQGGVLSFVVNGLSVSKIEQLLGEENISVRSGKHCSPLAHMTVGTKGGTVRVSVSYFTTKTEVERFVFLLKKIIQKNL